MLLRDALRTQSPSLALQRAAADEIARQDALVNQLEAQLKELLDATKAFLTEATPHSTREPQARLSPPCGSGGPSSEAPTDQGSAGGQVSPPWL